MSTESFKELEFEAKALEAAASASVLKAWDAEADAALRRARDGKRTIALVGFSPTSRHLAPFDDRRVTIWGVNEAHRHKSSYMKRWDGWFQLHKRFDFTKKSSIATREHWEWLQEEHNFPIFMQEAWGDVPSSVKYPLDEIRATYPGAMELLPSGEEVERAYYTSTFAYMMALAIWEIEKQDLPGRVEVYGFDMATMTEFQYQKGSTEYWIGFARGRGIEVTVPYKCRLLSGKLYGYEISRVIPRSMIQRLLEKANEVREDLLGRTRQVSEKRREIEEQALALENKDERKKMLESGRELFQQEVELARDLNVAYGEVQEYEDLIRYIEQSTTEENEVLLNRQLVEFRLNSINKDREKALKTAMVMRGRRSVSEQELVGIAEKEIPDDQRESLEKRGTDAFQAEFDAASMVNALYGRSKVAVALLRYLDNMDADDQVILAAMENDPLQKEEGK